MNDERRGSLLVIFLTVFIDLLGFGMVLPLLPIYGQQFAEAYDWSDQTAGAVIGLLMASFSAMQFLSSPIWGRLSDRHGRRPILMLGLAGSTLCYALFGLATLWQSLIGLFAARIGAGIAGATISTAAAYIADTTAATERAKGMALIGAAFALGITLGPLICGSALLFGGDAQHSPWPGFVASGLSAVALLLAINRLPESWHPGTESAVRPLWDTQALRAALATPSVGLLLFTGFVAIFSFATFESTLSVQVKAIADAATEEGASPGGFLEWLVDRAHGMGFEQIEDVRLLAVLVAFTYLGIVFTLAQGMLVRRLAGKVSDGALATTGAVLAIAGFLGLIEATLSASFEHLVVAMALEVVGFALVNPALQSLISRRSDPRYQGGILGLSQSAASLARILGPVCGMTLFARWPAWPYIFAAGLLTVALALIVAAVRGGHDFAAG